MLVILIFVSVANKKSFVNAVTKIDIRDLLLRENVDINCHVTFNHVLKSKKANQIF